MLESVFTARKINIAKFRAGKVKVLVVTDMAARGIDIPMLDYVINYDFPRRPKLFVHRVGRVARAGRSGTAYSLIAVDEVSNVLYRDLAYKSDITIRRDEMIGGYAQTMDEAYLCRFYSI